MICPIKQMKKRAQFPNAQTFTIIFRGLATSEHPKNAVVEAIKLFNQMKNDRRLQPNTIHLNAVLSVCSRAYDIDHLFLVAAGFEDLNLQPTAATYAIIFGGMRQYMWREYTTLDKENREANTRTMVNRAKNIWVEVMDKWRNGKIKLDESLVCSMGRLLLVSKERTEKLEVLDLLEQTMNIPNLVTKSAKKTPPPLPSSSATTSKSTEAPAAAAAVPRETRRRGPGYVEPGQNTLALILTTLLTARHTGAAAPYWNLLVHEQKLVPDNDNWLRMIGILKSSKSSAQAAQFLDTLPESGIEVQPRSFRIAMEACIRDNINPHVLANATRILATMQRHLNPEADMQTMRLYLRVALVSHAAFRTRAAAGDEAGAKAAYGLQIATALAELWEPYIALYNRYFKSATAAAAAGTAAGDSKAAGILYNNQKEVIALGRMMVGAFSKVVEERMLPGNDNRDMIIASAKINKGVHAFFADRELREPQLNKQATAARKLEQQQQQQQRGQEREEENRNGLQEAADNDAPVSRVASVFEIDMPSLEDGRDSKKGSAKPEDRVRQGSDFVWNTSKPMGPKKKSRRAHAANSVDTAADKSVIDRWVQGSCDHTLQADTTVPNEDFLHIKSPVNDKISSGTKSVDMAKFESNGDRAKSHENTGSPGGDKSVWATLLAKRKSSQ